MAPLLRVNGFDLSPYMDIQEDAGLDYTDPARITPEFTGSPALGEGQTYVGSAIANKVWAVPLLLEASTRAGLKQLIQNIRNNLVNGAQVEYAHDPAVDNSTYFYLEKGTLDEAYDYFIVSANAIKVVVHLTTRPYGGIGSMRTIASLSGTGPQQFLATGVLGDTWALANFETRVGSAVASGGRVIGFGIHSSASFLGIRQASLTGIDAAQASSVVVGASGAIGSNYVAIPVSPTGASGIAFTSYLTPPAGHVGRHRVFAVARSGLTAPITMYAMDRWGAVLGPTAQATVTDVSKWQLIDLGEVQVPARASGQEGVPTQMVQIVAGGSGAGINSSPALHLDNLIYLPLDIAPGLMRTPGAGGNSLLYNDTLKRFTTSQNLENSPVADSGQSWSLVAGRMIGQLNDGVWPRRSPILITYSVSGLSSNASGLYALASGAVNTDVSASLDVSITPTAVASFYTASGVVTFWGKAVTNASALVSGIGARLTLGPSQMLQLVSASVNGNVAVLASAGIASTLASGLYVGQKHTMTLNLRGNRADVYLATGALPASPILSASAVDVAQAGWPVLAGQLPSAFNVTAASGGMIGVENIVVQSLAGGASDIAPREWFRFESFPQLRAYQGNASVFSFDRAGQFRGVPLRIPPTGSPVASGGMTIVAFQGDPVNFLGNDGIDLRLDAMDRFSFFT